MAEKTCVLFATADWDTPYWTNKQHTASHLVKQGYKVLYVESIGLRAPTVNTPDIKRVFKRLLRGFRPPKLVEKDLWVLSPLAFPFKQHWKLVKILNQGWLGLRVKFFMWRKRFVNPLVWTYHPFVLEVLSVVNYDALVYHCVDDLAAIPGVDAEAFNHEERRLLSVSQAVFVTNQALEEKCKEHNSNTYYFPNVADSEHFGLALEEGGLPADIKNIPSPRIGYIGALSDFKVDFLLIYEVAINKVDWHWVIIGDEREGQHSALIEKLGGLPNIHFLGHRDYLDLPDYLRGINVATLPTLLNEYTKSMFPMKYFEYLAAGVPVVSAPLEFTKTNSAGLIVASDAKEFESAIAKQLENGRFSKPEAIALVAENTWSTRLSTMLSLIN